MFRKHLVLISIAVLAISGIVVFAQENEHGEAPHWGYEGEVGPEQWGDLNEDWALCGTGVAQSPINIETSSATEVGLVDIEFDYGMTMLNIFNNGHTIQVNVDEGSSITYNGITYDLLQFHFHAPSEHELNGEQSAMEIHFVHRDPNSGNLAVVGVMLQSGNEDNAAYADIFSNLPAEPGDPQESDISIDLGAMIPEGSHFYTYQGSLTTPPCSEIVRWLVQDTSVDLGADQVSAFTDIYTGNARPVQELGQRDLLHDNN